MLRRKADIISRLRPRFNEAFALEVIVRLERSAQADALLFAECPDRQQAVTYLQCLVCNQLFDAIRDLQVQVIANECFFHAAEKRACFDELY